MSKRSLVNDILEYVFNTYRDEDNTIREFESNYIKIEKECEKRRKKRCNKPAKEKYIVSKDVRNFLEPLVDAEYFKQDRYNACEVDNVVIKAMKELDTDYYDIIKGRYE